MNLHRSISLNPVFEVPTQYREYSFSQILWNAMQP